MVEETIQKLIKNVRKEKQILGRLIDNSKYSEEIKKELQEKYKEINQITVSLIEELLNSNKSKEEIFKEIDNITSKYSDKEQSLIINMNLKQLIQEQISTHKYINLPIKNNFEFQGAVRSIDGEYMVILYSIAKELLDKTNIKNDKDIILKAMINEFLADYSIKYYLMGEETFAEKFCNPHLYFDNNTIDYFLEAYDKKIEIYLSLAQATKFLYATKDKLKKYTESYNTMQNFSELHLIAQFIQARKHGHIPNIDLEKLNEEEKNIISITATKANKFCDEHQINNQHVYKKTR